MANVSASVRAQVARQATDVLEGRLDFWDFVEALPEGAKDDELIWELLDIMEHEPKVGGILGVSAKEHAEQMARAHRVIALLSRPTAVALEEIAPTDEAIEVGKCGCLHGVLEAAKDTVSGRLFAVCSDCGLQFRDPDAAWAPRDEFNVVDFVDATAQDIEAAGWGKYVNAYAELRRRERRNFLIKIALCIVAGCLYFGGLAYVQRAP